MRKAVYIEKRTYNRIVERLDLPQLKILREVYVDEGQYVCEIPADNDLGTGLDNFIYNDHKGRFVIEGRSSIIKLSKLLRALWKIEDPYKLEEFEKIWKNQFKVYTYIGLPSVIYNLEHCEFITYNDCMVGKGVFFGLFERAGLRVIYIKENGEITGRALVWISGGKIKVEAFDMELRRWKEIKGLVHSIWYCDKSSYGAIIDWARRRKLLYKPRGNYLYVSPLDFVNENGNRIKTYIRIKIFNIEKEFGPYFNPYDYLYPYIDTIDYIAMERIGDDLALVLYNSLDKVESNIVDYLDNCYSGEIGGRLYKCDICKDWFDKRVRREILNGKKIFVCENCYDRYFQK